MPEWLINKLQQLRAAGYTITECCDGDGTSWYNVLYTVTKDGITYQQNVRGWQLNLASIT